MNGFIVCGSFVVSVLLVGCSQPVVHQEPVQAAQPPAVEPRSATLAQQKMCADQATKAFKESDFSHKDKTAVEPAEYVSHYDAKAGVCYVAIRGIDTYDKNQTFTHHTVVFDAFEGRVFASYVWRSDKAKKFWEVSPIECSVTPRGKDAINCKDGTEFNQLIDELFGVGF
jgi:hypothetical protein